MPNEGTTGVEKTASVAVIVFITSGTILMRLCSYAAGRILLLWIYGWHRVWADHLTIVKEKPNLVISNGNILYGKSFVHYLIGVSMWLVSFAVFFILITRFLPYREREALKGKYTVSSPALLIAIALFFAIGMLPLLQSLLLAVVVLVIALLTPWMKNEMRDPR